MSFTAGAGTRFIVTSTTNPSGGITPPGPILGPLTFTAGTATTNTPAFDITQTWNNAAVTFTGLRFNVTDTASAAGSLLMDLQVGGLTRFGVSKSGTGVIFGYGGVNAGNITFGAVLTAANSVLLRGVGTGWNLEAFSNISVNVNSLIPFGWATSTYTTPDLQLWRDAANTLAQRNGVNAQTFNLYGTYTDGSNYRRVAIAMTAAGVASIAPAGLGTGASGNVLHISGLPTANPGPGILWNDAGTVKVGT